MKVKAYRCKNKQCWSVCGQDGVVTSHPSVVLFDCILTHFKRRSGLPVPLWRGEHSCLLINPKDVNFVPLVFDVKKAGFYVHHTGKPVFEARIVWLRKDESILALL